jgi:hypothetical protein
MSYCYTSDPPMPGVPIARWSTFVIDASDGLRDIGLDRPKLNGLDRWRVLSDAEEQAWGQPDAPPQGWDRRPK